MQTQLRGKKALITGGGVGIGLGIAKALADEGVDIAIANRGEYPDAIGELEATGVKALGLRADVSKEADVVRMVEEATTGLGGLDMFVNNVAAHWDEPALKLTAEGWNNAMATNLTACALACREVGRHLIKQKSGSILIIGSTAMCRVNAGEIAYRVSKAALYPYMQGLAAEMAPFNVRVNMITPGLYMTRMIEGLGYEGDAYDRAVAGILFRRPGDAYRELAPSAVLLLSDALSSYTTGANLHIDGGFSLAAIQQRTDEEVRTMNL